jgi:hypothetical protein
LDALGGKLILGVRFDVLLDVARDLIEAISHLLPVLLGAHRARDELLQHAGGDRLLARSPLNEQGDPHGDGYLLREALARHMLLAFRLLADNVDVGAH